MTDVCGWRRAASEHPGSVVRNVGEARRGTAGADGAGETVDVDTSGETVSRGGGEVTGAGAVEPSAVSVTADPFDDDPRLPGYFADAWPTVSAFAALLREQGVVRGLLGPNEPARLWERHLLNSAAASALLPTTGTLVDLGSGAGLPGVVLAAMRPAARVVLLEPMERRVEWLRVVVDELGLANTEVLRARAEEVAGSLVADAVTARAVSALDNLYRWSAPLVRPEGGLYAIKGERASDEVAAASKVAAKAGWTRAEVIVVEALPGAGPTRVVRAVRRGASARVR